MRVLIILGLVAFLAISLTSAWPADQSGSNNTSSDQSGSNNNSTESGSDQEGSGDDPVYLPWPRWPRWGGIGPVILRPHPPRPGTS